MQDRKLRGFTYFIMVYMLLAFIWWSVLLFTKNRDAFRAKMELQQIGLAAEGLIRSPEEFYASERYQQLRADYRRQENMILGETIFLSLSLLAGMYLIYRGYQREVLASQQQRNFLLSITHELKSPIASIQLVLETLLKRGHSLQPEQMTRLSSSGVKETDRLNKLVEDLLLSARLESAYQFHQEPLELVELAEKLVYNQLQQQPDLDLTLVAPPQLPIVYGDRQALTSVLLNLLENAIKYSLPPAHIRVELDQVGKEVRLQVADRGIGISHREKKRIFDKFYRIGNEDTRTTKGTGLGLFIVREIIRAHHGTIQVLNNPPHGTIFSVKLPVGAGPVGPLKRKSDVENTVG